MRVVLLLGLLLGLPACTIREETFAPGRDDTPGDMSLAPGNPNIPLRADGNLTCPGGFAKRSEIVELRDGSATLFCD